MAGENVVELTGDNFQSEVLESDLPVLVDFWAKWCGPCKALGPTIDALATEQRGRAKVGKVNLDEHQDLAVQYSISAIPTMLVFQGGQVIDKLVGVTSQQAMQDALEAADTTSAS